MDRIGIFAAAAALVLLSALHMLHAPNIWIALPAIMFGFGLFRFLVKPSPATSEHEASPVEDMTPSAAV